MNNDPLFGLFFAVCVVKSKEHEVRRRAHKQPPLV